MASRLLSDLHPDLQPLVDAFLSKCKAAGLDILITCTYRNNSEQDALYAQGRTAPGLRVTNAKGGQSEHNTTRVVSGKHIPAARAFDIVPLVHGKPVWSVSAQEWQIAGQIGTELGLVWYGAPHAKFREMPHFALRD